MSELCQNFEINKELFVICRTTVDLTVQCLGGPKLLVGTKWLRVRSGDRECIIFFFFPLTKCGEFGGLYDRCHTSCEHTPTWVNKSLYKLGENLSRGNLTGGVMNGNAFVVGFSQ